MKQNSEKSGIFKFLETFTFTDIVIDLMKKLYYRFYIHNDILRQKVSKIFKVQNFTKGAKL